MSDQLKREIQSMTQLGLSIAALREQITALTGASGLSEDDLRFCKETGIDPVAFAKHHRPVENRGRK